MKKNLLLFILLICQVIAYAQPICGFDDINEKLLANDPQYAVRTKANNQLILQYINSHPLSAHRPDVVLYTIPVVVHIVHTGGEIGSVYNPPDAQIIEAINYLNNVYNGTASGLSGGVGDMQIQFALAQRDPNCNPTTGIDRVDGSSITGYTAAGVNRNTSGGASELSVKNFSRWDPANYYNIWVVNKIDGADGITGGQFIAGFAYFPSASSTQDGTVMLASQMESGEKTLPHEIGHALNMYHPFQGSSVSTSCPTNTNCSTNGDMVCDTDPISYNANASGVVNFTCRTGTNSCTGTTYSINTERNFMNYTNCYTLFTAGQKERALAAMSLSNRASLATSATATPTYSAPQICAPKINFTSGNFTIQESTAASIDCKNYTDYSVNMSIASDPSDTAKVTLQPTGTATEQYDYQLGINGDFSSPGKVILFPPGAHDMQTFVVRVLDDAVIESQETIILNFSVANNGSGNALKGTANTSIIIKINDNDYNLLPAAGNNPAIGTSNYNSFTQPFSGSSSKARTAAIYRVAELKAIGLTGGSIISKLGLYIAAKASNAAYSGFTIKLKNTATNSFSTTGFETGTTTVYNSSYSTVAGLNTFTLATPFVWNGSSNLMVEFCYNNASAPGGNDLTRSTIQSNPLCTWNATTAGVGCTLVAAEDFIDNIGYVRPDITFTVENPVATAFNTMQTVYLGPNAEVYCKNKDTLIARIKNLTNFDYGCTSVLIDRAGTNAVNFWNSNAANSLAGKTFKITPANNNPAGQYEVTLYYTQNEINGWQTATGQNFNNIQVIKSEKAIASVTPANPTGGGTITVATSPIKDIFSSARAITATFDNGFSGFGAGILITTVYTFTGNGNWSTAANWAGSLIPPPILPSGSEIIINPINNGECVLNGSQTILQGALLNILPGKTLRIPGDLQIQ